MRIGKEGKALRAGDRGFDSRDSTEDTLFTGSRGAQPIHKLQQVFPSFHSPCNRYKTQDRHNQYR